MKNNRILKSIRFLNAIGYLLLAFASGYSSDWYYYQIDKNQAVSFAGAMAVVIFFFAGFQKAAKAVSGKGKSLVYIADNNVKLIVELPGTPGLFGAILIEHSWVIFKKGKLPKKYFQEKVRICQRPDAEQTMYGLLPAYRIN